MKSRCISEPLRVVCRLAVVAIALLLPACGGIPSFSSDGKTSVPQQGDKSSVSQFGKSDIDRLADVQMRENTLSLRLLMTKLYKRNPRELKKSTSGTVDEMVDWVFEGGHGWRFKKINEAEGTVAIQQAFEPDFAGDRVLSFIAGVQTMLIKAHGGKAEFYMTDSIEPQKIYNAARNVELAAWKLSTSRNSAGQLYLLSNELSDTERNLTFEREFGKIVGRLDLYAETLSEKSERLITRVAQGLATALFLPF